MTVNGWTLAGTSFLASAVEAVEALTIVLAVGVATSWRIALRAALYALLALAAIVAVFGPLLHLIPIDAWCWSRSPASREGLGVAWWGDDLSLLLLAVFYLAVAAVLVALARTPRTVRA